MCVYGYARVSSKDQREDLQIDALKNFGVEKIFVDKIGGKDFNRPQYRKLLRRLKPEDIFVVKSIDRLGRNYAEILNQWRVLTKAKRVAVVVLDMPLLDTHGRQTFERQSSNVFEAGALRHDNCRLTSCPPSTLHKKISARTAGKLLSVNHQTFLKRVRSDMTTAD